MKALNEKSIQETMLAVKRNTATSKCITVFEELLFEVSKMDESFVCTLIPDLNKFIEESFKVFGEADKLTDKRYKSKMISSDFIRPESFFVRTKAALKKKYKLGDDKHTVFNPNDILGGDTELSRKMLLLWNYIPAICKAIIQTKRRKLGFDKNSKKFN